MPESSPRSQPVYLGDHRALTRTAHGHALFVDTRDLAAAPRLLLDGAAHPVCADALRRFVRPGMTVLEVGAGYGELTLLSGELVGDGGRVIAFEHDATRAALLTDSLLANDHTGRTRVETDAAAGTDLDGYAETAGLRPDVVLVTAPADSHAVIAGAGSLIAHASDIRVLLASSPNGEAALLEAAGLVTLEAADGATVYGPPEALPVPVKPVVVIGFAEELFQFPDLVDGFATTYAGMAATLVVVGSGWEQHELDIRLDGLGWPTRLSRQNLDLIAVAVEPGSDAEADIAAMAGAAFSRSAAPPVSRL